MEMNSEYSTYSKNWESISLREIVNYVKGKKPKILSKKRNQNTVPYIDIKAFEKDEITQYADIKSSKLARKEDVLIVWDGARSGLVGINQEGAIGSTILALKPIHIDSKYLYRFLQSQFDYINSNPRGTGIPHVDPEVFWEIDFPLPPLKEQRRIVEKLEKLLHKVNACKERLDKIPSILKRLRQSILAAACSGRLTADWRTKNSEEENAANYLEAIKKARISIEKNKEYIKFLEKEYQSVNMFNENVPKGWLSLRTELFCHFITKGTTPKTSELKLKGDIPFLKVYNIIDNKISFDHKPTFISKKIHNNFLKRSKIYPRDVIMNIVGPPLNKVAIIPNDYPEWNINQALAIFRAVEGILPEFVFIVLSFEGTIKDVLQETKGIVGQSNISLEQCRNLRVLLPPLPEQKEIVRRVEALFKKADKIEARYNKAKAFVDRLTQSILAKAFRGELVPQDPNDEPASALLERIRETKKNTVIMRRQKRGKKDIVST